MTLAEGTDGQRVQCGLMTTVVEPPPGEELFWQSPTGGSEAHLSATRVFDIAAGQTVTYFLVCNNASGGLSSSIGSPRVMAIFTPAA